MLVIDQSRYLVNSINKQVTLKNTCILPVCMCTLHDVVEKLTCGFMIPPQMTSLTQLFTVKRCQVSALLNAHVSLSFSLDGQLIICYK